MIIHKEFLSIGEVAQVTGLPVHTLRFWETEFSLFFSPPRTEGRQRRYSEAEIGRILEIKKLLKEDKYSIAGAKQVLERRLGEVSDNGREKGRTNGRAAGRSGGLGLVKTAAGQLGTVEDWPAA